MIKDALSYLKEQFAVNIYNRELCGNYSDKSLQVIKKPIPAPITFSTLDDLVSFVSSHEQGSDIIVIVEDYNKVIAQLPPYVDGQTYIVAKSNLIGEIDFRFGKYYEAEEFIIKLSTQFERTDAVKVLLKMASSVQSVDSEEVNDNGISQHVTIRKGVMMKDSALIPNIVNLKPFRSFREIEQVESMFFFRMKKGSHGIEMALFELDGVSWRIEAMKRIKSRMMINVPHLKCYV